MSPVNGPWIIASDMHLRPDRPDRGRRLARVLDSVAAETSLLLAGDVCDFWFASRGPLVGELPCEGMRALRRHVTRGGTLSILPGNHDSWLARFYNERLGATVHDGPSMSLNIHGLRVHVVHGHRLGARPAWKAAMESHAFLRAFGAIPGPVAWSLGKLLDRSNHQRRDRDNQRHLSVFRRYAQEHSARADLVVFGHAHLALDESDTQPRLVVLGDWMRQASYLHIDEHGARQVIIEDDSLLVDRESTT